MVFPTRRAGLFFRKELAATLSAPIWSPTVFSIQDYIMKLSGKNIPDDLTLLFELFETYRQYFPNEDFARFYPWGELLLSDFNDIDRYMINGSKVFETVKDLQQIDRDFNLDEVDLERLRMFWKSFFDRDPSILKNEFMNTWKFLGSISGPIYSHAVGDNGYCFSGCNFFFIRSLHQTAFSEWDHIILIRFNGSCLFSSLDLTPV